MTTNDAAHSAIIELPRDMLDTIYEKYSEGENDARRAIATLNERLRRKQKQLNWYKEELSDLEDIRKMTVFLGDPWDGLAQDLERVQEKVRRATRELEALQQEYDRKQRERAIHFSPQKRKFLSILQRNRQVHASQACVGADLEPTKTCPLCLDDDAEEIALCENLGDFVNAEGQRQGHGVCTRCLPYYLTTEPDRCLVCRTPYGQRFNRERQNHLEPAIPPVSEENEEENEEERSCVFGCGETENLFWWAGGWVCQECYDDWMQRDASDSEPGERNGDAPANTVNAPLVNVVPSETCPLCLDDDAEEIALCENLGDFVNAEGERQGHGVCNTCLPAYLATGRDNCLICRTPYGDRWQTARKNHLPAPGFAGPLDAEPEDPWIREMQDYMAARDSDDSNVTLPYDDDSSSSDEDGPEVPFYGSRPTTRIPVFRRRQAPELFREAFAGARTQEDNGGFDLMEDGDSVRHYPDPLEIDSYVWAATDSIYTELSRHIPDHSRLPSNERYIGLGRVLNAWQEGVEAGEDLSTWWYTIEWDLSWVSATQPVYIRTDHPRAHVQVEQPRSFARDWVREVPSFHVDVEFKVDGFTPAFDVLIGMRRWEPIYCRVIRKMPILGITNQLVALSQEDGTFIQYKLVRAVDIFRGCELEHFQFKPHVWPSA